MANTQTETKKTATKKKPVLKAKSKALAVPVKRAKKTPVEKALAQVVAAISPAEEKEKPDVITEIEQTVEALAKLPQTIQGKGYKLVNLNSTDGAQIVVEKKSAAERLYEWNADRFPYHLVSRVAMKMPAALPLTHFLSADDFEELKDHFPPFYEQLQKTLFARKAMVAKILAENGPIPFEFLCECLNPSINKFIGLGDRYGKIQSVELREGWFGPRVYVKYSYSFWVNGKLKTRMTEHVMRPDGTSKTMMDWGFNLNPSQEKLDELFARGKKVIDLNNKCGYAMITGNLTYKVGWFTREAPATGRAIVDKAGHGLFNPSDREDRYDEEREGAILVECSEASADDVRSVDPTLTIFSFSAKKWGTVHVSQASDITFRDDSFEKLVMPDGDKKLVHTLVKNSDATLTSDLVDGKGGGCVLLLHGKPGLGKTLTAEAVAETLRRPLYAVSVGELGTNPETLEEKLQTVLQTAQRWNAVLLLDEADVFLEARRSGDIDRNAMVGTFLRLLEYYNGVLILTTNRVQDMDKAFYSRISLALRYGDFGSETREQVVANLLSANSVKLDEGAIMQIAKMDVNGRQIKNSIRIARFMAKEEARAVHAADIILVLNKLKDFQESFETKAA